MIFRRLLPLLCTPALAAALVACGSDDQPSSDGPRVVATTTHAADFTRAVGGDRVEVDQLLSANTDPHGYEPRPSDVRAVADAQLVVASGAGLDGWSNGLVASTRSKARIAELSDGLPVSRSGGEHSHDEEHAGEEHAEEEHAHEKHAEEGGEHGGEERDPHWWHDPRNARAAVEHIRDDLIRIDPAGAAEYRSNAAEYVEKIGRLDAGIARCLDAVPSSQRKLVTDHDAFGYFAERYDLEVVGTVIPSQTTESQASARDISKLAEVIEQERVKAIFPETSLNPDVARALADETGTTSRYTLFGDTLGPEGSAGATYLTMEVANADAIVRGLSGGRHGCAVPGIDGAR